MSEDFSVLAVAGRLEHLFVSIRGLDMKGVRRGLKSRVLEMGMIGMEEGEGEGQREK